LPRVCTLLCIFLALPALLHAADPASANPAASNQVQSAPVPPELRSNAFTLTVNGKPVDVARAADRLDFASFDISGPVDIEITAAEPGFWDRGVDIEPWRLGLRAARSGQTIRFRLPAPAKLAISRPRDFLNHAPMLFLFAGKPVPPAPKGPNVKTYSAGVYHESLNPKSGDTIYLAPGAFFYGSLNLWQVSNVKVLGRGTIIYDGPQDPNTDEGWMQKPDWHCIGSLEAHHIEIDGLTCVLRSRTWSIQMKNSSDFVYDDLRVIGGNPDNANQDGIDWLGTSNGLVRDSFFRASDDVIALIGNWDGYSEADMLRPGQDVHDITIETSELSTSISNIVRAGWPQKIFNSHNFTLRDSDILHSGIGACGQTFGLLGFWGANGAHGEHSGYTFENLFLDNWYSLVQMEQELPSLNDFTFRNIWALDQPPLADSSIKGQVNGVVFENVKYGQTVAAGDADIAVTVDASNPPKYSPSSGTVAAFTVDPAIVSVGQKITFTAESPHQDSPHTAFTWRFGDGTEAQGRRVIHVFTDSEGTDLDSANGAGRFRVLLQAVDEQSRAGQVAQDWAGQDWASQGVVAVSRWYNAVPATGPTLPGLAYQIYPGGWTQLPDLKNETALISGESPDLTADARGFTRYAAAWDGLLDIPADGGYTFHLMDRDGARLVIDGIEVARTGPPFAQVCGSPGNAMRYARGSLGLRAGPHTLHVEGLHYISQGTPRILWEGPSLPIADIPAAAFSHPRQDIITAK
jgi:hypothetical protein